MSSSPKAKLYPLRLALLCLLLFQLAFTLLSFRSLHDLLNDQPIINVDFCSQFYWAHAARQFWEQDRRLWGYDPYFMAGYPLDFIFNSSLPIQMVAVALAPLNLARLIKACFLVSFLLAPLSFLLALRWFGFDEKTALAGAILGVIHFWLGENALFGRWGMIAGAFLLHFFLLPLALLCRWLSQPKTSTLILLTIAFAISFTIHKTAFVLVLPLSLLWLLIFLRQLQLRTAIGVAMVFAVAAALNFHWLRPFFYFLPLKIEDPATTFFQNTDLFRALKDLWPAPPHPHFALSQLRLLLVISGIFGLARIKREQPSLFLCLSSGLLFFGVLSYFGSFLPPLRHLQPYRYVTAYFYLWALVAAPGMVLLLKRPAMDKNSRLLAVGAAAIGALYLLLLFFVFPSYRFFSRLAPLSTELDEASGKLVRWLEENTDSTARVLFEDINVWPESGPVIYAGAKLASLMPVLTDREMIGGPLPNAFIRHHFAAFEDGRLFGRRAAELSDDELTELAERYNIGWAVCWSEEAKARFSRYSRARLAASFDYLEVYELEREHSFFLEGGGQVRAFYNRLELSELTTSSGRVVVSYHWVEGLRSEPETELMPVMVGDDPVGFIGIADPGPKVVVKLAPFSSRR